MVNKVIELSMEQVLLFVILAFLLYYLLGNCGCTDGFSVGGQEQDSQEQDSQEQDSQEQDSQDEYYDPIEFTDGKYIFYGCYGALHIDWFGEICPSWAKGTIDNPPTNPNINPLNTWKCKKVELINDKCIDTMKE